jgi:hypothetical protein
MVRSLPRVQGIIHQTSTSSEIHVWNDTNRIIKVILIQENWPVSVGLTTPPTGPVVSTRKEEDVTHIRLIFYIDDCQYLSTTDCIGTRKSANKNLSTYSMLNNKD